MLFAWQAGIGKRICYCLLPLWLAASISMAVASAAVPIDPNHEEHNIRSSQDAAERQQRSQQKDVFLQQKTTQTEDFSLPDETPAFMINTVVLSGDSTGKFPWAEKLLQHYAGRKIGGAGVKLIVHRLTNAFIDRGYITTRISVPEQDLGSGVLTLALVPGRIGQIRLAEGSAKRNWQTAFPCRAGDILNLRDLEQALEQIKRVPSQDATMKIVPGDKPGESDVVIDIKEIKPWRLKLDIANTGTKLVGNNWGTTEFDLDNVSNSNDLLRVFFSGDTACQGGLRGIGGNYFWYSIPAGDRTFTLTEFAAKYHEPFLNYSYSSAMHNIELDITQLLRRDQTSKTDLEFSLIKENHSRNLAGMDLAVLHQDTNAVQIGLSHRKYIGEAIFDATLADKLGTCSLPELTGNPAIHYSIWLLDASLTKPATVGSLHGNYSIKLHGQYTNNTIFSSEYISIGDRYTVRGFDGNDGLAAERGWYLQNELAIPLGNAGMESYLGLDYGEVYGPATQGMSGRIMIGSVVGLRGWAKNLHYDVFVGWPLRKPDELQTASPTFGFQLDYQI